MSNQNRKPPVIWEKFDGVNLNASHYAAFTEKEGAEKMVADKVTDKLEWAKNAYKACVKAVKGNPTEKPADN